MNAAGIFFCGGDAERNIAIPPGTSRNGVGKGRLPVFIQASADVVRMASQWREKTRPGPQRGAAQKHPVIADAVLP